MEVQRAPCFNPDRASQDIPTLMVVHGTNITVRFNPERASQAIPTLTRPIAYGRLGWFQSRTGVPGHSDSGKPSGDTKPSQSFNPERASQAIPTWLNFA